MLTPIATWPLTCGYFTFSNNNTTYVGEWLLLIDKDLREVEKSCQLVFILLNVFVIYQETSLLFIGKSYPLFLFIFLWLRHLGLVNEENVHRNT